MVWNWQLANWPNFYFDFEGLAEVEKKFLLSAGSASAFLKKAERQEQEQLIIEILSLEGEKSSQIEGELLNRESLQSSVKRAFGLQVPSGRHHWKEEAVAALLCDVYKTYDEPLTHEMLQRWHALLFKRESFALAGQYRSHEEPMQIVGNRLDASRVFFEAPPSKRVCDEMEAFLKWFNAPTQSVLGKAAIAHVYFENIHPFEDGNGRIGRAIIEKSLSKEIGRPTLISVSKVLEKRKKEYYRALESCNQTLNATLWVEFFAGVVLQAQEDSLALMNFTIEKSRLFTKLAGKLHARQEKALLRMFAEGPKGFQGGLSAEKYIAITGCSRATATRDLAELVDLGALFKTGDLRYSRYWLAIDDSNRQSYL
jgi:Fic family protein